MTAASSLPAAPILAVMGFGVLVAIAGHVTKLRLLIGLGLALVFLATAGMLVGGFVAYHEDPGDPRPARPPGEPGF